MKPIDPTASEDSSTIEVARLLGLSVRSVQLMVDRGELEAWKTPGGHRRISSRSVELWRAANGLARPAAAARRRAPSADSAEAAPDRPTTVLLIDDSVHFQRLVTLLVAQRFPGVDMHVADDGIAGLALYGQLQPEVLIVDILLPGIDGAALITSLRSHPQFARSRLAVVTSLDESQRAPYSFALQDVPVIHKSHLVAQLPALLSIWLDEAPRPTPARPRVPASETGRKVR